MITALLIHPSAKVLGRKDNLFTNESLVPSLGLASLAAYARAAGMRVEILDLRLEGRGAEDVFGAITRLKPDLVGISAFTSEVTAAGRLAALIKEKFPSLPVVAGGPHPSLMTEETLLEFPAFDAAVRGEGELTFTELAGRIKDGSFPDLAGVKGLAYRSGGKPVLTPAREPIEDLGALPFPAWDLFELHRYNRIFPLSASRGCPHRCYFCTPAYLGKKVRVKKHQKVLEEINWLVSSFGAERIQFSDAMMGVFKDDSEALYEGLAASGLGKKVRWDCETRADAVSLELFRKMKAAGCEWVAMGVESGNERILREVVKKGETKAQIRTAASLARQAGLKLRAFFILGHHTETPETMKETIDFAIELDPDAIAFGLIVPNPGSELRAIAKTPGSGLRVLHDRWEDYQQFNYNCLEASAFPLAELKKWQSRAYFTFYAHNPLKALSMFFSGSAYNYRFTALLKLPFMLLRNLLKR